MQGHRLAAEELQEALGDCRIGNEIRVVEETSSTNDLVWDAEKRGAPEGLVVFAEHQTAGRGRQGQRWESAPYQGLWFSILLRPKIAMSESAKLTAILAGAITAAIREQTGCFPQVKPPNDIYLSGRKIAGVLVEGRTASEGKYVAVAGVGINVNQTIEDFPETLRAIAGSLAMATGRTLHRQELAVTILKKLESALEKGLG